METSDTDDRLRSSVEESANGRAFSRVIVDGDGGGENWDTDSHLSD
jgi:hypothetical protein